MGILPLVFMDDEHAETLGLGGTEVFSIAGIETLSPRKRLTVTAKKEDGQVTEFEVLARLDTDIEVDYYIHGGILPYVLRTLTAGRG
jgi:aconitate hydratase